jgi:ATP-dependent DNA ligase
MLLWHALPAPATFQSSSSPWAAHVVDKLPEGDDWMYEVKFDGYRALLLKDAERLQIRSRNDKDLTGAYPTVAAAGRRLHAKQAVVDGEIVAVDAKGRPSFQALQHRSAHPDRAIVFYAFDLLHLNGVDLTRAPLHKRRSKLPSVIAESGILLSSELAPSRCLDADANHSMLSPAMSTVRNLAQIGVREPRASSRPITNAVEQHHNGSKRRERPEFRTARFGRGCNKEI